jgi:hypothetical protein
VESAGRIVGERNVMLAPAELVVIVERLVTSFVSSVILIVFVRTWVSRFTIMMLAPTFGRLLVDPGAGVDASEMKGGPGLIVLKSQ